MSYPSEEYSTEAGVTAALYANALTAGYAHDVGCYELCNSETIFRVKRVELRKLQIRAAVTGFALFVAGSSLCLHTLRPCAL